MKHERLRDETRAAPREATRMVCSCGWHSEWIEGMPGVVALRLDWDFEWHQVAPGAPLERMAGR